MGAYANPQEIEGQFDFTQEQKSYQRMFDTITASAMKNSEKLAELYATRAKKNEALIKEVQEKKNANDTQIAEGTINNTTGLSLDFLSESTAENARLRALGTRTLKENKRLATTQAVADTVKDQLSGIAAIQKKSFEAMSKPPGAIGSIDVKGSDPDFLEFIKGMGNKDGNKVGLNWQTVIDDGVEEKDYSTTVGELKGTNKKWSLAEVNKKLTGGGDFGITYIPDPEENIQRIQTQSAAKDDGSGIFVMKDNEFTGKINKNYLNYSQKGTTKVTGRTANNGYKRIDMVAIDKNRIGSEIYPQAQAVVSGSQEKVNYLPSLYNNFMSKAIENQEKAKGKSIDGSRDLTEWEKYKNLGKTIPYGNDDPEYKVNLDDFAHNQVAMTLNSIPDYQPVGVEYVVYEKAKRIEDKGEITLKSDKPIYEAIEKNLKPILEKNKITKLEVGQSTPLNDPIPLSIEEKNNGVVAYRAILTKTKNGYSVRFVGNETDQNNQQ